MYFTNGLLFSKQFFSIIEKTQTRQPRKIQSLPLKTKQQKLPTDATEAVVQTIRRCYYIIVSLMHV